MIHVQRTNEPIVLRRNRDQWMRILSTAIDELQRLENDPNADKRAKENAKKKVERAQDKYRHPEIKEALETMFHGRCAYCESLIGVVSYGDIEHFRPKSYYIDKTFDWENLLLSCSKCNNPSHKGAQFPLDVNGQPLLIDPTSADPSTHLRFSWDTRTKTACIYGLDTQGKKVEEVFDLNGAKGRRKLINDRSGYVRKLLCLLEYAKQGHAEALAILRTACDASNETSEYVGFAKIYIEPYL